MSRARRAVAGFDRIKAPVERAAGERRAPLFSVEPPPVPAPTPSTASPPGPLIAAIECSGCGAVSPLDVFTLLRGLMPVAVVLPWLAHPWLTVCPSCAEPRWVRPRLARAGGS